MSGPSKNPTFKLSYFNLRAVAEPIRYLFAYGGQAYEDVRIEQSDWPKLKSTMPMGQMPVLDVDGHRVHQNVPIARYLGKRFGLAGSNEWESLQIDIVVDTFNDLRLKSADATFEADAALKQKKREVLLAETVPFYLGKLEQIAKENKGHLAISKLTWADFFFAAFVELLNVWVEPNLLSSYPNLQKVANNVYNLDAIKTWRNKRPVTDI